VSESNLVDAIRQARSALTATIEGTGAERLTAARPGEWSVTEVLAHLVNVDYYYLSEALATCAQSGRTFSYFDDAQWKAHHADVRMEPVTSLLARLRGSHAAVVAATAALPLDVLATPAVHPRGIPYTVRDILLRLPSHDANHADQVRAILAGTPN
jgi:uncharacterized damage-inducible protein DinB